MFILIHTHTETMDTFVTLLSPYVERCGLLILLGLIGRGNRVRGQTWNCTCIDLLISYIMLDIILIHEIITLYKMLTISVQDTFLSR